MIRRSAQDLRKNELAQIHIAKAQLGLDETTYRTMLREVGGVDSAADLDGPGRRRIIAHLKARGARLGRAGAPKRGADDRQPLIGKIDALLAAMALPRAYADGCARHMFGIARLEWCDPDQLRRIVAALAYHQRRQQGKGEAREPAA